MSAKSKQQNGQLEKAKADNDQPSSLSSSLSNVELIIKKPHSIWEYRPPLTVDKQLKPALKPYRSFNRGNQFSSLSASASASAQPFQSADVTACQHQKSSMDSSQKLHVTLRSERNFSVKESQVEAVKPLEKTEATTLLQATSATSQSVQSSFTGKQVEEGEEGEKEKEEEMQSFIAPKNIADHESLPSRPPSYRFSNFFSFFPQPSKEWHQQQLLFSATAAVYNSLSQQPPPNSSSSNSSSSSPPPSPPPPYVITTTSFTQTPISSSSTSSPLKPAARSTSRLHHFIKYLLSGSNLYQKKKKSKASKKLPKKAAAVVPSLEEDYQVTDRLEKVMKRVTLAATFLIFCAVLVLIARRCIAFNADDADSKRNLFQQQIIAPSSGRLDLSQFDHLRGQVKVNRSRPSAESLQEAVSRRKSFSNSLSSSDQSRRDLLIAGLDGRVLANGGGEREGSNTNSNLGLEKENGGSEFVVVSNSGGNRGRFHSPPRARPFNPPPPPPQKPFIPFEKPLNRPQLGDNCSNCVQAKYLAHYYLKQCTAVVSRECPNTCTKYFRCPQKKTEPTTAKPVIKFGEDVNQQQQENLGCHYGGVRYAFGAQIPLLSEPCRFCRCRKRRFFNGTDSSSSSSSSIIGEIDCSPYIECPEMVFGVKASPGCHFTYRHDECCGRQLCPDELPGDDIKVRTVCRYRGKEYKYGEKIYPEEDTCKKCICDEQWNNHDPVGSKSCVQVRCTGYLKEEITKKCTPIYRADGCCPIDYICPPQKKLYDARDDQLDQTTVGDEIPQSCTLRGKSYKFGQQLYIDRTDTHHGRVCAKCTCQVPPLFTCMADFRCSGQ